MTKIEKLDKAIELLKEATGFVDAVRFLDEDLDENNLEGRINLFLKEMKNQEK